MTLFSLRLRMWLHVDLHLHISARKSHVDQSRSKTTASGPSHSALDTEPHWTLAHRPDPAASLIHHLRGSGGDGGLHNRPTIVSRCMHGALPHAVARRRSHLVTPQRWLGDPRCRAARFTLGISISSHSSSDVVEWHTCRSPPRFRRPLRST